MGVVVFFDVLEIIKLIRKRIVDKAKLYICCLLRVVDDKMRINLQKTFLLFCACQL